MRVNIYMLKSIYIKVNVSLNIALVSQFVISDVELHTSCTRAQAVVDILSFILPYICVSGSKISINSVINRFY